MFKRRSARTYLMGLIAAAVVPVWLFAAYVLVSFAMAQQEAYRDRAVELARQAAVAVDGKLRDMVLRIDALAKSPAFVEGDFAAIDAEARHLVEDGGSMQLLDQAGRRLFDTDIAIGQPLPPASTPFRLEDFASETPGRVSGVFIDPVSGDPRVAVAKRLTMKDGSPALITLSLPTEALHASLASLVPEPWIVGVGDRDGVYVTRSQLHEEVSGKPGVSAYLSQATGPAGSFTADNQFGETLLAGYVRSDFSGWLYAANVRLALVAAPLWRSLYIILAIGALALAISLLLAYALARRLTNETGRLARQALALGGGEPVAPLATRLREFALISDALVDADRMIGERTSELQAVLETVPVAVWFTYDPSGQQVIRNRFAADLMDVSVDHEHPFGAPDPVTATVAFKNGEVVSREDRPLTRAMRGEVTDNEEYLYRLPTGRELILSMSARPIYGDGGKLVGAVQISLDITERKRAESQRKLLTKELDHRVKNNLAIVQALVQQTLRNATDLDEARQVVLDRLSALAKAHDLLARNAWLEGDLRATIAAAVQLQTADSRVALDGPDVSLSPGQVMAVSLAMHELTTNAIKYGALSNDEGRIEVSWQVTAETPGELVLHWKEIGGPPVKNPSRRGFGSRLLEKMTASEGGSAERIFDASGVLCTFRLPLRERDDADPATREPHPSSGI